MVTAKKTPPKRATKQKYIVLCVKNGDSEIFNASSYQDAITQAQDYGTFGYGNVTGQEAAVMTVADFIKAAKVFVQPATWIEKSK